jgi:uncharacterized protein HemY
LSNKEKKKQCSKADKEGLKEINIGKYKESQRKIKNKERKKERNVFAFCWVSAHYIRSLNL